MSLGRSVVVHFWQQDTCIRSTEFKSCCALIAEHWQRCVVLISKARPCTLTEAGHLLARWSSD